MTDERAIEILDPEHREHYESIEPVEEACRIGIKAIKRVKELETENAALRERLGRAVNKRVVANMLAKYFDCPCNFSPIDEEMFDFCNECCNDNVICWEKVIEKSNAEARLAELNGEADENIRHE